MNHFVKCCASLFAKILYVDTTAAIAPIEITNNNKDCYMTDRLGKWILFSEGSWVFNKKEKGTNDVYARFCLKSQRPTYSSTRVMGP